jgi:CPA2 family monovalent cation:H+ antiporter-2
VRHELYAPLYEAHHEYQFIAQLQSAARLLDLTWLILPEQSPVGGQTLQNLDIRNKTGASIVCVMREGRFIPNPGGDYRLLAGDTLAVLADQAQLRAFRQLIEAG